MRPARRDRLLKRRARKNARRRLIPQALLTGTRRDVAGTSPIAGMGGDNPDASTTPIAP